MSIKFFRLLAPVIDKMVEFAAGQERISINDIHNRIVAEAERNHQEWYSNRVPNLNYQNPDCRLAYLYIVAGANASTFKHVIETNEDLRNYILRVANERCQIKICALGAGPGTELLAMAKFFDEKRLGFAVSVDFQLLDKVEEWRNSWYRIRDEVHNTFLQLYGNMREKWPMIPAGDFLTRDVTQLEGLTQFGDVWTHDIYVVNFLLSEIFYDDPGLRAFLSKISGSAPRDAHFVFIERRGGMWEDRMAAIARDAGLILSPFIESKCESLEDEDPRDLRAIYAAISTRKHPRISWNVVYSIGRKI